VYYQKGGISSLDNPFENEKWIEFRNAMTPSVNDVLGLLQGRTESSIPSEEDIFEQIKMKSEDPVYKYLHSLDMETIKFIQTVMYIGRDYNENDNKTPEGIYNFQKEELDFIGWRSKSIEINQMLGQAPLYQYLINGLRIIQR